MRAEEMGVVWTEPNVCRPLDDMTITFRYEKLSGQPVTFEVFDADHHRYLQTTVTSTKGQAVLRFQPGNELGTQYIVVTAQMSATETKRRWGSFRIEADTRIRTDRPMVDKVFDRLAEGLKLSFDIVQVDGQPIPYHKCADNTWSNLAYPAFFTPAVRYFMRDMKPMFDVIYANQWPSGQLPDHIYGDDHPGWERQRRIRSMMADLETGMITAVYKAWVANGDDEWMRSLLPKMEAGIEFVLASAHMFDKTFGLIKRPHTMDEWDYQLGDTSVFINENSRFVVMQGDTSAMFETCGLLAELHEALGNAKRADHWRKEREYYCETGNRVFWDGKKYRHHIHIDPLDHGDFNEDDQLTMSNSWAMTRGFADHAKCIAILDEYCRRWKMTGDRYPWWSLNPGYPTETVFGPGVYANGGLFPWVGGELCRAAFEHGREELAVTLLKDFAEAVERDHGAVFTWYTADGLPAITSPEQTNYDSWGMQPWTQAVVEGLAGVRSVGKVFKRVLCAPRWPSAEVTSANVVAHFPASEAYFAYQYSQSASSVDLCFTGSGDDVTFRVLLPTSSHVTAVTLDGQAAAYVCETIEQSQYVVIDAAIAGSRRLTVQLKA